MLGAEKLRQFADSQLLLPIAGTFSDYADLQRPFATWVVFAAPADSLQPKTWCFPVAGCLNYIGFFDKDMAESQGEKLEKLGFDVHVSGSPAYSTLGWFDDPLLNTFIDWQQSRLASLMFHEMAHQKLYIADDSTFNESYAEAVSQIGVRLWLRKYGSPEELARYEGSILRHRAFLGAVGELRGELQRLYALPVTAEEKKRAKQKIIASYRIKYGKDHFGGWFAKEINNAKLGSVNTYSYLVDDFLRIYQRNGKNIQRFYLTVRQIAQLTKSQRLQKLIHGE